VLRADAVGARPCAWTKNGNPVSGRPVRDWLRLCRVRDWVHFLPIPLATFDPDAPRNAALLAAARGIAGAFTILAFGFLLNSVADRRMDLDARKNPLIVPGADEHRYSLAALLVLALVLAAMGPWPVQVATCSCLLLGCVYSAGPRLKSVPIAGSLANAAGFALLLFVGMRNASLPPRFGYVVLAFAALVLQNQLIHEAADRLEDRAGGIRTTWLMLGPRWTAVVAALSGLGATVAAAGIMPTLRLAPVVAIVGAAFGMAFPLLLAWRGMESTQAARLRLAHRWCAVLFGAGFFAAWRYAA